MSTIKTNQLAHTANGASVYTLPQTDGSAGEFIKTDGSGNLSFGGAGITMADQYRLTSNFSLSSGSTLYYLTSNWERPDTDNWAGIGTGMSESSGVFTFPQTGIYQISYHALWDTSNTVTNAWSYIDVTTNNSSYNTSVQACVSMQASQMSTASLQTFFDVEDVSTHKVKFKHYASTTGSVVTGQTDANRTYATFIRLGDT